MTDFVRVYRPASNMDATVSRGFAIATGLKILDKPAVDKAGKPIRSKPHEPIGTPKITPAKSRGEADEATSNTEANKEATS